MKLTPLIAPFLSAFGLLAVLLSAPFSESAWARSTPPIVVKLGVMEGETIPDTNPTYNRVLEASLYYGVGETAQRLEGCGYHLEIIPMLFDWDDKLAPKEKAAALERQGSWIIFGPESSYGYLVAKKGLKDTALVSPMAGARAVTGLKAPYFTMYPTIDKLAAAAVRGANGMKFGKKYGVLVDASCPSCKDFADEFTRQAKGSHDQQFWVDVVGNTPDLTPLFTELASHNIDFLLAPNFSSLSGYLIKEVNKKFPHVKFVGADSWGDEQTSPLEKFDLPKTVQGIHVRAGGSAVEMRDHYKLSSLNRSQAGQTELPHFSAYMMVNFVRSLVDDLCKAKPKDKKQYLESLKNLDPDHFKSGVGVGVFSLVGGKADYLYSVLEKN